MKTFTLASFKMASPIIASVIAILLVSIFPETKAIICPLVTSAGID